MFATNTRDMDRELARLKSSAVLVWLGRDRPEVGVDVIERAFCTQFAVRQGDLTVAKHHPEDFIVDFKHRHHRAAATTTTIPAVAATPHRRQDPESRCAVATPSTTGLATEEEMGKLEGLNHHI